MGPRRLRRGCRAAPGTCAKHGLFQWGHGEFAGDDRGNVITSATQLCGFNGATASSPWMTAKQTSLRESFLGFNGATASSPWMTPAIGRSLYQAGSLQWGHGEFAVDDHLESGARLRPAKASMAPRRGRRG